MMKNALPALVLTLALVVLLTWLLLHVAGPRGSDYVFAQRDVARVAQAEAALRGDVLQARAGLLRNYDPLVDDITVLQNSADELRRQAMVRDGDQGLLDELMEKTVQDEAALERFKTDNALLQNALSYFDAMDNRLAVTDPRLASAIAVLGNSIFHLTHDSSLPVQQIVRRRLDAVTALATAIPDPRLQGEVERLITHGQMLAHLLPDVDRDLKTIFSISTYDLRQGIRASQDARRAAEEGKARQFRLTLYGVTILLTMVLVRVGLQWRNGRHLLRQHTEAEAVIADMSARFLVCPPDRHDAMINTMLGRLGPVFGADRAYVVLADRPEALQLWQRPGMIQGSMTGGNAGLPDAWPGNTLKPALAMAEGADDLIDVPLVSALPEGPLRDCLMSSGTMSWCGIILRYGIGHVGLLAFGCTRPSASWPGGGAGMVRMAGEVVSSALQRRHATLQRLEFEARLSRVRRLETLGTFASGIAHNFNNVIAAILGYAEMAAGSIQPGTAPARHVEEIHRAGERAKQLVGRILDFGTRGSVVRQKLSLDALLAETVTMVRASLPDGVELMVEPGAPGGFVAGDMVQLQQVVLNLVRNAVQATEQSGEIIVRTDLQRSDAPLLLSHDSLPPGDYVRLCVIDTGEGMNPATLATLFQPFFTTRSSGTGLGLATVREIMQDHDGAVDVISAPDRGASFSMWLPRARSTCASTAAVIQAGTGQTVMLIGHDQADILHDEEMLAALGYEPVGFRSLDAAVSACRDAPGRFDVILIDLTTVREHGLPAIATLQQIVPYCPIVLLVWELADLDTSAFAIAGFSEIIQRPLKSAEVAAVLAECCRARG